MCMDTGAGDPSEVREIAAGLKGADRLSDHPTKVRLLDVSYNDIEDLTGLAEYKNLEVLTLDNNPVTAVAGLPALPNLKTLWLNNNSIADVEEAVEVFASQLPNLEYLSILGNPGAKSELTGASKAQCETQRHFITYKIPSLKFLNASPITAQDKAEAAKKSKVLQSLVSGDQIDKTATVKITTHAVLDQESKKQQPSFGKQRRFYTGKFSEGNRFICDDAL